MVAGEKICGKISLSHQSIYQLINYSLCVNPSIFPLQSQADDSFSSTNKQVYTYAAVIVAIWQKFPDFGNLFLALLYKACPYLVPYFIPQVSDQSLEDYSK